MKLTDERIKDYLKKKHGENFDIEQFLNVSIDKLRDAKKFNNIDEITAKINAAISDGKKILVYGDYDCDGVCATTILYLFLKSQGANVSVFIPLITPEVEE
jgi:single-stranded DNA-specific DHH superfamily exonuclease